MHLHLPAIHAYTYTYFDAQTFTDTKSCADAQGSSYSAAAPVTCCNEKETHSSARKS